MNTIQALNNDFNIKVARVGQISKIIKGLNPKKETGPDKIPVKIVKLVASVVDFHLSYIINKYNDLSNDAFSDTAKVDSVRPIYKKDDRKKIKKYRPVSLLNSFSKI